MKGFRLISLCMRLFDLRFNIWAVVFCLTYYLPLEAATRLGVNHAFDRYTLGDQTIC